MRTTALMCKYEYQIEMRIGIYGQKNGARACDEADL